MVAGMDSHGWDQRFTDNPNHFGTDPNTLLKRHVSGLAPGTVVAALPDTWTVDVAETVDRGEGSADALVVATAPQA